MSLIPPLELETWVMSVFAGTPEIFIAVALFAIAIMAGYFRMTILITFFMMGVFLLMFSGFVSSPILILMLILGGLLSGFVMAKIFAL